MAARLWKVALAATLVTPGACARESEGASPPREARKLTVLQGRVEIWSIPPK